MPAKIDLPREIVAQNKLITYFSDNLLYRT